jgi:Tfp pilus assembly protein PilV
MTRRARYAARRGISMMEVAVGTLLVGGVLATTIELIGPTVRSTVLAGDRQLARTLADELLDEIASLPFGEPSGDPGVIGRDSGEAAGDRKNFDDMDDYHGYASRPTQRGGSNLVGFDATWQYTVDVQHIVLFSPQTTSGSLTNAKRATVTVTRGGVTLAQRSIVRTKDFNDARKPR